MLNPTLQDFFYQHPDLTLLGLVWAAAWRAFAIWIIILAIPALTSHILNN